MRAVLQQGFGGVEVLAVRVVPDPTPGAGDVVVRVVACGVNRLDVLQRRGPALLPGFASGHIAGMDIAGTVEAVGSAVTGVGTGDRVVVNPAVPCWTCACCLSGDDARCLRARVLGGNAPGGYAEYVLVPATNVHPVPDHVPLAEAALVPTIWTTAWHALNAVGGLLSGETMLVHAAASGVSLAAIQLAKQLGATVVATASSAEKLAFADGLGADRLVLAGADTTTEQVVAAVREATAGRGVDLALDHVGPATWTASLYSLAPGGRLVFLGNTTGNEVTVPLEYAYHFGLRLLGSDPYPAHEFAEVLDRYWRGGLVTPVDSEFALTDAAAAQCRLEGRLAIGKILLRP